MKATSKKVGSHDYRRFKIQPVEFLMANRKELDTLQCEIINHTLRLRFSTNWREDLEKIKHYCELWEEIYDSEQTPSGKVQRVPIKR